MLADFLFVCFAIRFMLWGNTLRPVVFFILLYSVAGISQYLFHMRNNQGNCWTYPQVPSFLVDYDRSSSFYYSTLIGTLTYFCIENTTLNNKFMMGLSLFSCIYASILAIIMRSDYTVSIITGVGMGHYFWIMSGKISEKIDKKLGFKS